MVSIVVYSSDGYSDCWDPFFTLLKKNFPLDESYEIILLTNEKKYSFSGLDVITMQNGMNSPWSKRLKLGIEKAKNNIIFLIGDDFFLLSKMNQNLFKVQLERIDRENNIDHIRLLHKPNKFKSYASNYSGLNLIEKYTKYRFLYAPSLWKKEVILKYIVNFETPFMAEKMGTYRSWILKDSFYCLSEDFINKNGRLFDCGTSGVIVKGKWANWSVPILEKENLGINFNIRGIREENEKKMAMYKARLHQLLDPISTLKSYSSVVWLSFKSFAGLLK